MSRIETLLRLVLDDDYTVVADAIETAKVSTIFFHKDVLKHLLLSKREKDDTYGIFLFDNCEDLLALFSNIFQEIDITSLTNFKQEESKAGSITEDSAPLALK